MNALVPLIVLAVVYSASSAPSNQDNNNVNQNKEFSEPLEKIYETSEPCNLGWCRTKRAAEKDGELNYNEFIDKYNNRSDKYGLKSFNPKGSVANDALELEKNGKKIDNPQAPLTSVYTFHHDGLDISLPTVIRARIDGAALKSVVKPRDPNAINKAVPNLTTLLKTVKDTFGNAYDVGHIIANQLGGPDVDYNYAPMSGPLNRSAYKKMENDVKSWVSKTSKQGGFVDMLVVIYYDETIFPMSVGVNRAFYSTESDLVRSIDDVVYANNFKEDIKPAE